MQVRNVLHAARWKCRTQKNAKNATFGHYRTTLSGYIFANKARIDNRKKILNSNVSPTCPQNMVYFGLLAAEICWGVWGTPAHFNGLISRLGSVTARYSSSGIQPNFAALNRGRHLYSAGRPSRWACPHCSLIWFDMINRFNVNISLYMRVL